MSNTILSNQIGFALMQAGLSPFALDMELFQIVREGENYVVDTECLPEVFISKTVPTDFFEYNRRSEILFQAIDWVNCRRTSVVVYRGLSSDSLTFRCYLKPAPVEAFSEDLEACFVKIERAIDAFGHACEVLLRTIKS